MKTSITLALWLTLGSGAMLAQSFGEVNPAPQSIAKTSEKNVAMPQKAYVAADAKRYGTYPLQSLSAWVNVAPDKKNNFPIYVGVKGDKTIKKYEKFIPQKEEGYYLSVQADRIVIAGADERGLFYGIQTLKQSLKNGALPMGEVTDFPDVKYRGVVEGFYGTPWSHRDRLSQLDFYGKHKLNVYIYGPKDDPYHSVPNWRKPYPEKEAKQIKELVEYAHKNGVIFYWAIHPGQDIKWNEEDRNLLIAKFEKMYELGVRGFAVFFDDISGEGTKADKQAELLNYIDNHFVQKKKDVAPLVMCPTEYNKGWSNIEKGYLPTLGNKLNPGIEIMWTGNTVIACIDKPDMEWINGHIKRKAYIWWNFPVSDYVRDHLLLGATYGNSLDIANDLSGFLSNPMERAEASKIALYSVADYTWNMKNYDSDKSWRRAVAELLPNDAEALQVVANHNSDLGPNGHRFRRDESVELQPALAKLWDSRGQDVEAYIKVLQECGRLSAAADILLAGKENVALIDEIRPWLKQSKLLGDYGVQVLSLVQEKDVKQFAKTYKHAKSLQTLMYEVDSKENQNPYQPGVKVGSKVLLPTLDNLFTYAVTEYNKQHNQQLDSKTTYTPFTLESTVPQLASQPLRTRGGTLTASPSNEVIKWEKGKHLTINSESPIKASEILFDLGVNNIASAFTLEVKVNGSWVNIPLQQGGNTRITANTGNLAFTALRLTQVHDAEAQVYFKNFKLVQKAN